MLKRTAPIITAVALLAVPSTALGQRPAHKHHAAHHTRHIPCSKAHLCAYGLTERACLADERDYWIEIDGENYCERMGIVGEEHTAHTVTVTITLPL